MEDGFAICEPGMRICMSRRSYGAAYRHAGTWISSDQFPRFRMRLEDCFCPFPVGFGSIGILEVVHGAGGTAILLSVGWEKEGLYEHRNVAT
jgi:hypothetical protein